MQFECGTASQVSDGMQNAKDLCPAFVQLTSHAPERLTCIGRCGIKSQASHAFFQVHSCNSTIVPCITLVDAFSLSTFALNRLISAALNRFALRASRLTKAWSTLPM